MTSPTLPEAKPHSPILLADPRVRAIAVRDNGEPLVDLPAWLTAATGSAARSRRGVAIRLRAAALLLPADLRLRVVEGYRCAADQLAIEAAYRLVVSKEHPSADTAEIERLTSRFVAPLEVAGHVAGAAVDLTLHDPDGAPVDLGCPVDATPEQSEGRCYLDSPLVSPTVRARRQVLARALRRVGLVNYATEWWHWSFGDRYWAFVTGRLCAVYGPLDAAVLPLASLSCNR